MTTGSEFQEQGLKLFKQRDYETAAQVFKQAQDAYVAEGKADLAAEMQVNIGLVHRSLGENQQSLDSMQEALTTFQGINDARRSAMVLGNMGGVYAAMGDKEQAYNCYRQAADIFQELGDKKLYGETMIAMGDLQMRDGKIMTGASTYEVGLENLNELSASQKVLKGLMGVRNKLTGGGSGDKSE
jgi:tetratricopeptide (TPR) repeat protein